MLWMVFLVKLYSTPHAENNHDCAISNNSPPRRHEREGGARPRASQINPVVENAREPRRNNLRTSSPNFLAARRTQL